MLNIVDKHNAMLCITSTIIIKYVPEATVSAWKAALLSIHKQQKEYK